MGIFDRFKRKKGKEKQAADKTYILTRQGADGGMRKVMDLAKDMTPEELYPVLEAGIYAVHIYTKGQNGFDSGPMFKVDGKESEKHEKGERKQSPFSGMKDFLEEWKGMKDDAKSVAVLFGEMFSEKKVTMDDAMAYMDTLKKHKDTLDGLFPSATTGNRDIPLSGSIPAWMAFVPQVIDQSANALEIRLQRWGLIEAVGASELSKEEDPIRLPEKPKMLEQMQPKKEEKRDVTSMEISLPEKPKLSEKSVTEVREETVEDEKDEDEGEDEEVGES